MLSKTLYFVKCPIIYIYFTKLLLYQKWDFCP